MEPTAITIWKVETKSIEAFFLILMPIPTRLPHVLPPFYWPVPFLKAKEVVPCKIIVVDHNPALNGYSWRTRIEKRLKGLL
jgi:hypothetical protein